MNDGVEAYPLTWPVGWRRTSPDQRKASAFASRTLADARDAVLVELRRLGAKATIISTNMPLRRDGLPYSSGRRSDDPGVAVYFTLSGAPKVLACDRWRTVEDNLWAIAKHIEAIRGQERWGVGTVEQAFMGYDALPAPKTAWWEILGVDRNATDEEIRAAYRQRVKETHPDAGGSEEEFLKVQAAFEAAGRR